MELNALRTLLPDMIERRRHLHRHPELSFMEKKTSEMVAEQLALLDIEVRTGIGGYGVIGIIRGELAGKVVALRADMDALPIQDEKTVEYASQVPGVMHACGHDGHTAILLAVAQYFSQRKKSLKGDIVLIFQPAEEVCPGGALSMIEAGALQDVDVIYGIHLWTPLPLGTVASAPGPMMASSDDFFIDIQGQGGHGGMPHKTVDSVVAASSLVMQLQSVVSRSVDPLDPAVLTIGSIQGGTVQNAIADRCRLAGTVRCFNETTRLSMRDRIHALVEGTAQAYGAKATIDYTMGYPSLVNHREEFERFYKVAEGLEGITPEISLKVMPAEDFSYYLQQVPGCFIFVGAANDEQGTSYPHHHPKFDINEEAMLHGASLFIALAECYQNQTSV